MPYIERNSCVGCEVCGHCGRDHERVFVCDGCGDHIYDQYFSWQGQDLCPDCIYKAMQAELCELGMIDEARDWDTDEMASYLEVNNYGVDC